MDHVLWSTGVVILCTRIRIVFVWSCTYTFGTSEGTFDVQLFFCYLLEHLTWETCENFRGLISHARVISLFRPVINNLNILNPLLRFWYQQLEIAIIGRERHLVVKTNCQALVRFFALHWIKPHAPPFVRPPVNSFEFHSCERIPRLGLWLCSMPFLRSDFKFFCGSLCFLFSSTEPLFVIYWLFPVQAPFCSRYFYITHFCFLIYLNVIKISLYIHIQYIYICNGWSLSFFFS